MSTSSPSGSFLWMEYVAEDAPAALAFYKEALGYTADRVEDGTKVEYFALKVGDTPRAGLYASPWKEVRSNWLPYIRVADAAAAAKKAESLGGRIAPGPEARGEERDPRHRDRSQRRGRRPPAVAHRRAGEVSGRNETMRKNITRVLAVLAIVVLGVVLPACEFGGLRLLDHDLRRRYGYSVYGGYYPAGHGAAATGAVRGVVVRPPVGVLRRRAGGALLIS